MLARYTLSSCICPSVRHTLVLYQNSYTQDYVTMPYDSTQALVFWRHRSRQNSNGVIKMGTPNKGGVERLKAVIFDQYIAISQ